MRRLLIATVAVGIAAGTAAPALAGLPVTITGHENGGICVGVADQEPQCIDLGKPTATGK